MKIQNLFRQNSQNFQNFFGPLILCLLLILSTTSGCTGTKPTAATPPAPISQDELARVQLVSETVAEEGTREALLENPSWRPQFEKTWAALDQAMTDGNITALELRNLVNTLPIDQLQSRDVRLAITGARLVYYAAGGADVTMIDSQSRAWSAAIGIRTGMGRALGK